jgi:hypothetical protein
MKKRKKQQPNEPLKMTFEISEESSEMVVKLERIAQELLTDSPKTPQPPE